MRIESINFHIFFSLLILNNLFELFIELEILYIFFKIKIERPILFAGNIFFLLFYYEAFPE